MFSRIHGQIWNKQIVTIYLVLYRRAGNLKDKLNVTVGISSDNGTSIELQRVISTHDSGLAEIRGDDPNDIEEEVITVEYNNLTSQRVSINKFIEDLPNRKNNGDLEKEFDVCLIILFWQFRLGLRKFKRTLFCFSNINDVTLFFF